MILLAVATQTAGVSDRRTPDGITAQIPAVTT